MQRSGPLDEPRQTSNTLVVLLHGAFKTPRSSAKRLSDVRTVVRRVLDSPDILAPQLPTHAFAFVDPDLLAWRVVSMIDDRIAQHEAAGSTPIEHIVLVGYSFGGLLARMVYVLACGETETERWIIRDANGALRPLFSEKLPEAIKSRDWAGKVRRLVLLAGMNRGWTIDFRVAGLARSVFFRASEKIVISLERLVNFARWILRMQHRAAFGLTFRRGGRFVSALRWQWLRMRQHSSRGVAGQALGGAPVVQLLGTKDDVVGPEDNIDPVTGQDFIYLEMPDCGHNTVVDMDLPAVESIPPEQKDSRRFYRQLPPRQGRGGLLARVLEHLDAEDFTAGIQALSIHPKSDNQGAGDQTAEEPEVAASHQYFPGEKQPDNGSMSGLDTRTSLRPKQGITDIAFVIHGIRDLGYWTQKVAWRISEYGTRAGRNFTWVTRSYGYFPMWPFLFPARRRQHVEWLVDQILEVKAQYPQATMHYCGHSNGTYLLARALEDHSFLQFQHVVFAGSVVRDKYPWREMIARHQVGGVLNYIATADLVVGWFPKLFQSLPVIRRWNDIGGGGFDGFAELSRLEKSEESFSRARCALQIAYVRGGHGAAIGEHSWGDIARAIVDGKIQRPGPPLFEPNQSRFIAAFSRWPVTVWILLILILYSVLCLTLWVNPIHFVNGATRWIRSLKNWETVAWCQLLLVWIEWRLLRFVLLRL